MSGAGAQQKAAELRADAADGVSPLAAKHARKASELQAANNNFIALTREWIEIRRPDMAITRPWPKEEFGTARCTQSPATQKAKGSTSKV